MKVIESDNPDRLPIDFTIEDDGDNVCWVWGTGEPVAIDNSVYSRDINVECDHTKITYGDDDEQGECAICGARCDWHWEEDNGDVEDYHWEGRVRVPHQWYMSNVPAGMVKKCLEEVYGA